MKFLTQRHIRFELTSKKQSFDYRSGALNIRPRHPFKNVDILRNINEREILRGLLFPKKTLLEYQRTIILEKILIKLSKDHKFGKLYVQEYQRTLFW